MVQLRRIFGLQQANRPCILNQARTARFEIHSPRIETLAEYSNAPQCGQPLCGAARSHLARLAGQCWQALAGFVRESNCSSQRRTSRYTTHVRCHPDCKARKRWADRDLLARARSSNAGRNREGALEVYLPTSRLSARHRRELRAPTQLREASDKTGKSRDLATRNSSQPHATISR